MVDDDTRKRYLKAFLPAGIALLIFGVLIALTSGKDEPIAAVPTTAGTTASAATATTTPTTTTEPVAPTGAPDAPQAAHSTHYPIESVKAASTDEEIARAIEAGLEPPKFVEPPKGKPWTKEEKLERAKLSIKTIELREKTLADEIAAAEKSGNKQDADEKKVLLMRLRKHKDEILVKLDAGEPP